MCMKGAVNNDRINFIVEKKESGQTGFLIRTKYIKT